MDGDGGYVCRSCGEWHEELPFGYGSGAPAFWCDELADDPESTLGEEQCVIGGEHFFVRGRICLPVEGAAAPFEWGIWVSISEENFLRMSDLWEEEGRESEPPMSGWLCSELPLYEPTTMRLKTIVHTQPVGVRPIVELEPAEHPLSVEQREGITRERVQQLAETLLHAY